MRPWQAPKASVAASTLGASTDPGASLSPALRRNAGRFLFGGLGSQLAAPTRIPIQAMALPLIAARGLVLLDHGTVVLSELRSVPIAQLLQTNGGHACYAVIYLARHKLHRPARWGLMSQTLPPPQKRTPRTPPNADRLTVLPLPGQHFTHPRRVQYNTLTWHPPEWLQRPTPCGAKLGTWRRRRRKKAATSSDLARVPPQKCPHDRASTNPHPVWG